MERKAKEVEWDGICEVLAGCLRDHRLNQLSQGPQELLKSCSWIKATNISVTTEVDA